MEGWLPFLWKYLHEYKWRYLKTLASAWQDRKLCTQRIAGAEISGRCGGVLPRGQLRPYYSICCWRRRGQQNRTKWPVMFVVDVLAHFQECANDPDVFTQNQTLIFLSSSLQLLTVTGGALSGRISSIIVLLQSKTTLKLAHQTNSLFPVCTEKSFSYLLTGTTHGFLIKAFFRVKQYWNKKLNQTNKSSVFPVCQNH